MNNTAKIKNTILKKGNLKINHNGTTIPAAVIGKPVK